MRRYITVLSGLCFALLVMVTVQAVAQSRDSDSTTQTTTTQTTTTTTTTGKQTSVEGCLLKEQSDFFLLPRSGRPIKLQTSAGENLSEYEGHHIRVSGNETAISSAPATTTTATTSGGVTGTASSTRASTETNPSGSSAVGAAAGTPEGAATGAATGSGSDLHKLATQELAVSRVQHIAATCPVNWNPGVHTPRR